MWNPFKFISNGATRNRVQPASAVNLDAPGTQTSNSTEVVMRYITPSMWTLSPTAATCTDYLWKLAYGMDYTFNSRNVTSKVVADAFVSLLNYGVAILDLSDQGLTCVKVDGAQLSYNAYGEPVTGLWMAFDNTLRPAHLVLAGPNKPITEEHRDILSLESTLYSKLNQYVLNLGITGMVVKAAPGTPPVTIKKLTNKFQTLAQDKNSGCVVVTDADIETIAYNKVTVDELVSDNKLITVRNMICGAYGIGPDVIWNEGSNRATAEQASKNVIKFCVYPLVYYICSTLTNNGYDAIVEPLKDQEIAQGDVDKEVSPDDPDKPQ